MRTLEVFFDYECPYCKRGYEDLKELLKEHDDIEVVWRVCEAHPRPEDHPPHTDLALQGYFFAKEHGADIIAYHDRLFDAVHVDQIDVESAEVLADYTSHLVDRDAYLKALTDGTYKQIQEEHNDYAYEENEVWFLPAFRMDGKKLDAEGGVGVSREALAAFLKK